MAKLVTSPWAWYNEHGTIEGFYEQWGVLKPELDGVYAADAEIVFCKWEYKIFKIIFIDDNVALGVEVINDPHRKEKPAYRTFNACNGWKYQDDRSHYRLRPLDVVEAMREEKEAPYK